MKRLCFLLAIILLLSIFLYGCAPSNQVNLIYHKVEVGEKNNNAIVEVCLRNDGKTLEYVNLDGEGSIAILISASGKEYRSWTPPVLSGAMGTFYSGVSLTIEYEFRDLEESGYYTLEFHFEEYSFIIEDIDIQLPR